MRKFLQTIQIKLFGPRIGSSISSNAPESDFKPVRPKPVQFVAEIEESETTRNGEIRSPRPAGDGWKWRDGEGCWYRRVKFVKRCGHYHGKECECENPAAVETERHRQVRTINDPFA